MAQTGTSELGNYLRAAREARGVSLSQAAAETRIVQRYLVALEMGEFQHLPGDVYARGFLRNYAQYLQLPIEELLEMYRAERGASMPIRVVPTSVMPQKRRSLLPTPLAVVLAVTVLVVLGYVVLNALGVTSGQNVAIDDQPATTIPTPEPLPTFIPNASPSAVDPNQIISPLDPSPTPTAGVSPTPDAPVVVVVRVLDSASWMEISVDNQVVVQTQQNPGWTQTFTAQALVRVKAGNAAAVEVSFNGGPFNRMSAIQGDVQTAVYRPND